MTVPTAWLTHTGEQPIQQFDWGTLQWLANGALAPGAEQTFGRSTILPGQANPLHLHPNCQELLYVVAGRGRHRCGDEWFDLVAGSLIQIPAGMPHQLQNSGDDPLECLISFSSADRQTVWL